MIYNKMKPEEIFGQAIGQLIHDIRNSLNTIIGFSSILKEDNSINKENLGLLDKIFQSGMDIDNQLLNIDFYMIENEEINYAKEKIDLIEIIKDFFNSKKRILDEKQIIVNYHFDNSVEFVFSKDIFKKILENLLRFSMKGLQSSKTKEIDIFIKKNKNKLTFLFSDSSSCIFIDDDYFTFNEIMKSGRGLGALFVEKYILFFDGTIKYCYGNKWLNIISELSIKIKNNHGFIIEFKDK